MKPAPEELQARLGERFHGAMVSVVDDSHLHAGHKGAEGGAGHFTVNIVSDEFAGLGRLARLLRRCVARALGRFDAGRFGWL